jgi:hypothetical protein
LIVQPESLVGPEAQDFAGRDYDAVTDDELPQLLWQRARAIKVLGTESDSWARLAAGLLAWLAAVAGGAGLAVGAWAGAPVALRVLGPVAGAALLAFGTVLGRRVWRAGRAVVNAFCWWTLLPERLDGGGAGVEGWRASPARDAVEARVFVFQGWRPLRIVLGVLAFFAPIAWADQLDRGGRAFYTGQTAALWVFSLVLAVAGVCAGVVVFGGQVRANRAHSQRDPVQRRLLGRR